MSVCERVHVCVCVCVCDRERETERETEIERGRGRMSFRKKMTPLHSSLSQYQRSTVGLPMEISISSPLQWTLGSESNLYRVAFISANVNVHSFFFCLPDVNVKVSVCVLALR